MGEILILKSLNGSRLTNKLVDSWLEANEPFVIRKNFSPDQYSVEITFVDEERAEMILDLLSTCYGDHISISRPPPLASSSMADSFEKEDNEREPSPVHLSSALSTSSKASCFSRRLQQRDKEINENSINMSKAGRGRGVETTTNSRNDTSFVQTINNDKRNSTSPVPSLAESTISSAFGRGRASIKK